MCTVTEPLASISFNNARRLRCLRGILLAKHPSTSSLCFQGGCPSYPHCIADSLRIQLQPCSKWSNKQQPIPVYLPKEFDCFWRRSRSFSGPLCAPCAWESGKPSVANLGPAMSQSKCTADKDGTAEQRDPQNMGRVNLGNVGNANMSTGGEVREQLLKGDSNGGSIQGLPQWAIGRTECPPKLLTLVIIHKNGKVLLGMKKRGFGKGYYNGFGGKVENGETVDEAAARELQEEAGVTAVDMSERAVLTFHFENNPVPWEVHVYHVSEIAGDPCETEEMEPRWFAESEIPYDTMWEDDILWYPEFLKGRHFKGSFYFENTTTLVAHAFQVISS